MRDDRMHQFFLGSLEIHCNYVALNELRDFRPDHMRAEQLSSFLVEDDFHQTLIFPERNRLAVTHEWKTADANIDFFLLCGLFGQADGCNLWRAISAARNHRLVHRVRTETLDCLDANDALMLGLVRQHRRP